MVITTTGPVTAPAVQERTARLVSALTPLAHVSEVVSPFAAGGAHQISKDGHIAYVQVVFDQQAGNLPEAAINTVVSTAQSFEAPGYHVALGGQAISLVAGGKPGSSEGIGILAAIIIMLLAFGSVVAMGLPIITALFGIAIAFALLDLLSHVITTPTFAPEMMAMIGLGVGIDYALFIVTRYRQGLAEGRTPRQATAVSLATSGRSVVFAGTTVILSLLGLFILQLPFMRGLAVGAIAAVVLVMLAAITLLPAMLGFSGLAIDKLHLPGLLQNARRAVSPGVLVPVEPDRAAPPDPIRPGRAGLPGPVGPAVLLHAAGLHRRRQRSDHQHHPPGLRRAGHRVRTGVQRASDRGGIGTGRRDRPPWRPCGPRSPPPPGWSSPPRPSFRRRAATR